MTGKYSIVLIRVAVYILLPVFVYTRPMLPAPVKTQYLAFILAVLLAEAARRMTSNPGWLRWIHAAPLLASVGGIFPYRFQLGYFDTPHQLLIGLVVLLGTLYWAERRLSAH